MLRPLLRACAVLALIVLCFPSLASAQSAPLTSPGQVEVRALAGLNSIKVEVEGTGDDAGLARDIERRLAAKGLPIAGVAFRGRLVLSYKSDGDAVLIRLRLLRLASMTCAGDLFYTSMWERERFTRRSQADKAATELIDTFAADYSSINRP